MQLPNTLNRTLSALEHIRLDNHGYLVADFYGAEEGTHFHTVQEEIEQEFNVLLSEVL